MTSAYLEAYQATGEPFYREVVEETLAYVLREMTSPEGPFYSTQDADSEGEEGKFFVWSAAEIEQVLGKELAERLQRRLRRDAGGQLGRPQHPAPHQDLRAGRPAAARSPRPELRRRLDEASGKLFEVRSQPRLAGPRREGADLVERPDDRRLRPGRRRCWTSRPTPTAAAAPPTSS